MISSQLDLKIKAADATTEAKENDEAYVLSLVKAAMAETKKDNASTTTTPKPLKSSLKSIVGRAWNI